MSKNRVLLVLGAVLLLVGAEAPWGAITNAAIGFSQPISGIALGGLGTLAAGVVLLAIGLAVKEKPGKVLSLPAAVVAALSEIYVVYKLAGYALLLTGAGAGSGVSISYGLFALSPLGALLALIGGLLKTPLRMRMLVSEGHATTPGQAAQREVAGAEAVDAGGSSFSEPARTGTTEEGAMALDRRRGGAASGEAGVAVARVRSTRRFVAIGGIAAALLLLGGGLAYTQLRPKSPPPTQDVSAAYTAAVETIVAQLGAAHAAASLEATQPPTLAATSPGAGLSRENPALGSEGVDVGGGVALRVVGVTRPADSMVAAGSASNPTPAPSLEYLMVQIQLFCGKTQPEACSFTTSEVKAVGRDGQVHDPEVLAGVAGRMEQPAYQFPGGSAIQGVLIYQVPSIDPGVVLYDEASQLGTPVYISLQ